MMTTITCSACQQVCQYDSTQVQSQVVCPTCQALIDLQHNQNPFTVPAATAVGPRQPHYPSPSQSGTTDPALRFVVPVDVSPLALIAGYLGLFSLIILPAPLALILGIVAIRQIKKSNGQLHGLGRAWFAVIMGAIFTLIPVFLIIAGIIAG